MRVKKLWAFSFMICLALAMTFGCATTTQTSDAAKPAAEADWKFHDIVDVNFVMQQLKVPLPADVTIVDSRPKRAKYDKGHIPMAINIPTTQFDKMTALLPKDKNALLIFYCGGPT
jgi:hypothetical protein